MKQNKSRVKQPAEFYETYFKNTTYCVLCKRLLIEEEYMFCKKCNKDLKATGKDPDKMIKEYEKERRKK